MVPWGSWKICWEENDEAIISGWFVASPCVTRPQTTTHAQKPCSRNARLNVVPSLGGKVRLHLQWPGNCIPNIYQTCNII